MNQVNKFFSEDRDCCEVMHVTGPSKAISEDLLDVNIEYTRCDHNVRSIYSLISSLLFSFETDDDEIFADTIIFSLSNSSLKLVNWKTAYLLLLQCMFENSPDECQTKISRSLIGAPRRIMVRPHDVTARITTATIFLHIVRVI